MLSKLSISQKGLVLVSVPILFELLFIAALVFSLNKAENEAWKEAHSRAVVSEANNLSGLFYQATSVLISYGVVQSESTKELFLATEKRIRERIRFLSLLLAENKNPGKSIEALKKTSDHALHLMESTVAQFENQDLKNAQLDRLAVFAAAKAAMVDLIAATRAVVEEQEALEKVDPKAQEQARNAVRLSIIFGVFLNVIIAAFLAVFFGREIAGRLKVILDNTNLMAAGKDLNEALGGSDEIARLDKAFHEMTLAVAEANRKERAVVENALDVICLLDKEGRFGKVNPAATKQWGYSQEELLGKKLEDFLWQEDAESSAKALSEILLVENGSYPPFENRLQHKSGKLIDLRWSAHWSKEDETIFCVAHDITDRKEAERFKQQLVQMVSHDLRTPLASLQHVNEMLMLGVYGELPPSALDCLRISDKNTGRLMRLINDFLDFEKMSAGKMQLSYAMVQVKDLFEHSLSAVEAFAADSEIKVMLENMEKPLVLEADADRLIQVLINLLSNAIKFSKKGSTVILSAKLLDKELEFAVSDEGEGIAEDLQASIFGRFSQIAPREKKGAKIKGTGLGLSICKGFVEAHGGTIGVRSKLGEGSTFWFRIPLTRS